MIILKKFDFLIRIPKKNKKKTNMEPPPSKTELIGHLNDEFLMTQCTEATEKMLIGGISITRVGQFIKDYQLKYITMKCKEPEIAGHFTFEAWYKWTQSKQNN